MTPEQIRFATRALAGMKTVSVSASQPHDAQSLSDHLIRNNIQFGSINLADVTATGFSRDGAAAVAALAKTFRPATHQHSHLASNATLARVIAGEIITRWKGRSSTSLSTADFDQLGDVIESWFAAQKHVRQHVVPCILLPYRAPSFTMGPVTFCHLYDFPSERFGIDRTDFWPAPPSKCKRWGQEVWAALRGNPVVHAKPGGFHFEQLIQLAQERYAPWMALVDVPGRAHSESIAAADVATDIALSAIQLVCPGFDLRRLSRATGRAAPVWRIDVWGQRDGSIGQAIRNNEPARAVSPDLFALQLAQMEPVLSSMGRRLSSYLAATSPLPDLDGAWCNAAYWYHEALAEDLDTVAVAKLETAIEVLFRAENMTGSKRRLLDSFAAVFGLAEADAIHPASRVTVGQFVISITTARSRVLHGTWPTLHSDLPGAKGQPPITFGDVELLTRLLLVEISGYIDAYIQSGETADSTEALLNWMKAKRAASQTLATPPVPPSHSCRLP